MRLTPFCQLIMGQLIIGLLITGLVLAGLTAAAPVAAQRVTVERVAAGLNSPWAVAFLPAPPGVLGDMLVTERGGTLRRVSPDGAISEPIAGVPEVWARGQGGLLDLALAPDFAQSGTLFFSYSEPGSGRRAGTAVARARLAGNRLRDVDVIFRQQPKVAGGRHFGSRVEVTPEGHVFITAGDRGQRRQAQDTSNHIGTVVRLNADGAVPADNPFVDRDEGRPEIWSYGHRNPQGAALHPQTGALWIHEHGPQGGDEVNIPRRGRNYGWPVITHGIGYDGQPIGSGESSAPGMEQPIHYWDPSIAPSGMAFITGDRYPGWEGDLIVGALAGRLIAHLDVEGEAIVAETRYLADRGARIRDVAMGPDGYVYLLTDSGNAQLLRLVVR